MARRHKKSRLGGLVRGVLAAEHSIALVGRGAGEIAEKIAAGWDAALPIWSLMRRWNRDVSRDAQKKADVVR